MILSENIKYLTRAAFSTPTWVDRVMDWKLRGKIVRRCRANDLRQMRGTIFQTLMNENMDR